MESAFLSPMEKGGALLSLSDGELDGELSLHRRESLFASFPGTLLLQRAVTRAQLLSDARVRGASKARCVRRAASHKASRDVPFNPSTLKALG